MVRFAIAFLVAAGMVNLLHAEEINTTFKLGATAPAYSKLEGVDGKQHSLADLKNKDVVVLVITCNHCPVAMAYENRLIDFVKKYGAD
jgi:cytochrome oxidase Cu insertion factor (SCO1/SenC/PrrC family)